MAQFGDIVRGGVFVFDIITTGVQLRKIIHEIAADIDGVVISLGVLHQRSNELRQIIKALVTRVFGGERNDQEVRDIRPGSLHVLLHCFTDKRFLEVFKDYESGGMEKRLQKEFSQTGIKMQGLKVEISNMDAVKQTIAAIGVRKSFSKATEKDEPSKAYTSHEGFQIKISEEHGHWLTISEFILALKKPISIYADEIVKTFHEKLCKDLRDYGKCTNPDDCKQKKHTDHCSSCKHWLEKLAEHKDGDNRGRKNCDSARWSEDHWEVAKFFMPPLGDNLNTVKDAESTDLSSLLNVLERMKDTAFPEKTRVKVARVTELRSQVRNKWAHAPNQEFSDGEKQESFLIAIQFLVKLEKKFSKPENGECLKHLIKLNENGFTNVLNSEWRSLLLQRQLLCDIKDEITSLKVEQSSAKNAIEEHGQKLDKLERAFNDWSQRMSDFESLKDNINEQFNNISKELKRFSLVSHEIHEIHESIGKLSEVPDKIDGMCEGIHQIRDQLSKNDRLNVEREPTSCLPEKAPNFITRKETKKVISSLMKDEEAIVSLHGGPGFGKTSIAVQVSHKLHEDCNVPVVFSYLSTASTINEMVQRLCCDVGVNYDNNDPKPSFIFWLNNIKKKVVFVLDDIDNLLEKEEKTHLFEFLRLMRKNSNQHCQIVTTSRSSYSISELSTAKVQVDEMDDEECMKLLKKRCPEQEDEILSKLAELCGKVPLAMCIASSRFDDFKHSDQLLQHLKEQPMETLESPESDQYVYRAINMSYEMLDDDQKEAFVRLAVFEGNFDEEAAKAVIEKEDLPTKSFLTNFVSRSLIKQQTENRFSIHLLIQHFLSDQLKSKDQKAKRSHAEALMVKYYLDLGHKLTIESYSKDSYKDTREALKKEAHNIQNVLKLCNQQKDINSDIFNSLSTSQIYTSTARLFSIFVRTVVPGSIVDEFLQRCAMLAGEREKLTIKLTFDCLLADQECTQSTGESNEYFKMMEKITEEFEKHYGDLKEDKSLCSHYYYLHARYLIETFYRKQSELPAFTKAGEQLMKLWSIIYQGSPDTPEGTANMVTSLLNFGKVWRMIDKNEHHSKQLPVDDKELAKKHYNQIIKGCEMYLGEHELTAACYEASADHISLLENYEKAHNYTKAKKMREKLGLDGSEGHVYLLNKLGKCLTYSNRTSEAIKLLEEARDMAEKLAESDAPNVCKAKVYTSLAIAHKLKEQHSEIAVNYANKAREFDEINTVIEKPELLELEQILSKQR